MKTDQTDTPIHVQKCLGGESPSTPEAQYVYSNQLKREPGLCLQLYKKKGLLIKINKEAGVFHNGFLQAQLF